MEKETIEIPFGARDSELGDFEYTIPEGFEAEIKDGKVIVRKVESEDERIRKALIDYMASIIDINGIKGETIVAWLEKQGEQKNAEEIISNPDYISPKDKALFKIANVLSQHEDKNGSPLEEIRSILVDYGINNLEPNEKKSVEWNYDDEQYLLICKNALAKYQVSDKWDAGIISRWLENRLKYLCPQPKVEWSEEDEKMWLSAIEYVRTYPAHTNSVVDWLKSLRLRSHWKPTEEQIKCLDKALGLFSDTEVGNYRQGVLEELLEQLKAL